MLTGGNLPSFSAPSKAHSSQLLLPHSHPRRLSESSCTETTCSFSTVCITLPQKKDKVNRNSSCLIRFLQKSLRISCQLFYTTPTFLYHTSALPRRSRLPPRSVLGAPHRGAAPEAAGETKSFCPCHLKFGLIPGFPGFKPFSLLYENHYYGIIAAKNARKTAKNRKIQHEIQHGLHTKTTRFYAGFGCPLSKRQLQQRSRQKGTATQERWLFPFSCKRRVTAKKDGEKTPREANPHWAP